MSKADKEHFDTYRLQTKVKHTILSKYLPAFMSVLGSTNNNILYIDGFSGRGFYLDEHGSECLGSPLRALEVISSNKAFSDKVMCYFVERRADHFKELESRIKNFTASKKIKKKPELFQGAFSTFMSEFHEFLDDPANKLAPTFLFVDPCGVEDVLLNDVAAILRRPGCEAFIFFNYEGVNRIAGLAEATGKSKTLSDLFGSAERAGHLVESLGGADNPNEREQLIMSHFREALAGAADAKYFLPFRIESESKKATSHYLLHATKHERGFKIMKEVMEKVAREEGAEPGEFQLLQASPSFAGLFVDANIQSARESILKHLKKGKCLVSTFRNDWVLRPDDLFTSSSYRQILLDLEADGEIEVLDPEGKTVQLPEKRRPYKGAPTLPEKNWVRLA